MIGNQEEKVGLGKHLRKNFQHTFAATNAKKPVVDESNP
jgi:hypothetical protein